MEKDYFNQQQYLRRNGQFDDDQTTQYSVQASVLTRNMVPHDMHGVQRQRNQSLEGGDISQTMIDYSDSVSQMGKSAS